MFSFNKFTDRLNYSSIYKLLFDIRIYGKIFVFLFNTNLKLKLVPTILGANARKDENKSIWCTSKIICRFVRFGFRCNYKEGMERKREKRKICLISAEKITFDDKLLFVCFFVATDQCLEKFTQKNTHTHTNFNVVMVVVFMSKLNTSTFVRLTFND